MRTVALVNKEPSAPAGDLALLHAIARRRDRKAFAELFARHHRAVYNLARHLTPSADAAEDVVQEAMLRAWTGADTFRREGSVRSWLLRIVAREAIRANQKSCAEGNRIVRRQVQTPPMFDSCQAATLENDEQLAALRDSVSRLNEKERTLLALYFGAEMSQEEIGRQLNMKQTTVSRAIQVLLEQLRGNLGRAGFGAAVPMVCARHLSAVVLESEAPPPGLLESVASRIAAAGSSVSQKAAAAKAVSPAFGAWFAAGLAGVLALGSGAWWLTQSAAPREKASAAGPSTAAAVPEASKFSARSPAESERKPLRVRWTFDGKLPDEIQPLKGVPCYVGIGESGRSGLLLQSWDEFSCLIRVPVTERPLHIKAMVSKVREIQNSALNFNITDGSAILPIRAWIHPSNYWPMEGLTPFEYYYSGEWCFAVANGKLRGAARLEHMPAERYLVLSGTNVAVDSLEMTEIECTELPVDLRSPEAAIQGLVPKKLKSGKQP